MKKPAKIIRMNKVASLKDYEPLMSVDVKKEVWQKIKAALIKQHRGNTTTTC